MGGNMGAEGLVIVMRMCRITITSRHLTRVAGGMDWTEDLKTPATPSCRPTLSLFVSVALVLVGYFGRGAASLYTYPSTIELYIGTHISVHFHLLQIDSRIKDSHFRSRLAIDALPLLDGVDVAGARISRILFECWFGHVESGTLLIAATSPALALKAIKRKVGRRTIRPQYPRVPLRVLPISPTPPSDYASGYCGWGACSNQFEMRGKGRERSYSSKRVVYSAASEK
ncbi:hypothetical protein BD779DRAFT_1475655 [Infundibulicybe gibba]|nr:hypothetical protein BD779DRAFT_1475655 [Infundibulicybe gibba]